MRSYKKLPKKPGGASRKNAILFRTAALVLAAAGVFLICRTGYRYLCRSELFRVSTVNITGCQRLSQEEIRDIAKVNIRSNVLGIDVSDIGRKLEKHPWVKQAILRKELPDKLNIQIIEKQPVALLQDAGLYYVDSDATVMTKVKPAENVDFPVITGAKRQDLINGSENLQGLKKILRLLPTKKRVEDTLPARNISEIHLDPARGLILYTVDGHFCIRMGTGDVEKKFQRLEMVLFDLYKKQAYNSVSYIDCDSYPNRILVREKVKS